ncbi:MAG: efflux RND transporter periplasmic adaptor subunit [Candidatus Aminicenantes bacterium]|nr:efflux RND transporter periplasmic adaptor subunit [Candidatus Aminicenantes bacterium]
MRKTVIILIVLWIALAFGCGKSGEAPQAGEAAAAANPGQKPGRKPRNAADIDVDKLNIPDKLKQEIKSGRIPKEKIPEILANIRGGAGADQGEAYPVSVGSVLRKSLNSYLVLNGVVEPERKVEVFSRLAAYVKQILKEEGDFVKESDILALLDDTEIRISYEQAKIELEQARLILEEAEQNYTRNKELIARELISEQEYQTQEAQYKQRQLDYQNRTENFKNLELQLNYTKIRALSEGYITERLIEVGTRVTANQQVYTIEDFKPLLIRVYVPTSDAIKLKEKMTAEVTTEVLKGNIFAGNLKLINPRIDVQTGTVKVTVEVFDETLRLKPGMFVEVRIVIGQKENALVIPRKAILYKQNRTYAFILNGNQVTQREITLGLTEEDDAEVSGGLAEGDIIVTVGVDGLKDGQRVDVVQ